MLHKPPLKIYCSSATDLKDETERRVHEMSSLRDEIEQKRGVIKEIQIEVVSFINIQWLQIST